MHTCARIFDLLASMNRNDNRKLTTLSMDNIWDDKRVIPDMDVTVGWNGGSRRPKLKKLWVLGLTLILYS